MYQALDAVSYLRTYAEEDYQTMNTLLILEDYLKYAPTQPLQHQQVKRILNTWLTIPTTSLSVGCLFTEDLDSRYQRAVAEYKKHATGAFFVFREQPTTLDLLELLITTEAIKEKK